MIYASRIVKAFPCAVVMIMFVSFSANESLAQVRIAMANPNDSKSRCVQQHPTLNYHFKPYCKDEIVRSGSRSKMSYNELGLRDRDYPPKAKPGWIRVLFVGASDLGAPGLAEEEGPARRFEYYLRKTHPKLEVINGGVEGYCATQSAINAEASIARYSPHYVVFLANFGPGAMLDAMMKIDVRRDEKNQYIVGSTVKDVIAKYPLVGNWVMKDWRNRFEFLQTLLRSFLRIQLSFRCKYLNFNDDDRANCFLDPMLFFVKHLQVVTERSNAKFILTFNSARVVNLLSLPPGGWNFEAAKILDNFAPEISIDSRTIPAALTRREVPFFELPARTEISPNPFLPADFHFSKEGADALARLMAEKIAPTLVRPRVN